MKAAMVQMCSTPDVSENLRFCENALADAADAEWIIFPENASFCGADEEKQKVKQSLGGEIVTTFAGWAKSTGKWITMGSFAETSPDPRKTFNTTVHFNPMGEIAAVYRKIHLFDVALPDVNFMESDHIIPGNDLCVVPIGDFTIGSTVCYDLRFPEIYRALIDLGSNVLIVPSAFTRKTGEAHWSALLRARAIENQSYVVGCNQTGNHYGNRFSYGYSVAFDPWGDVLCEGTEAPAVLQFDLDIDRVKQIRGQMPCLEHRNQILISPQ